MLPQLQDPNVETGVTNQLLEDVLPFQESQFILQARTFIKKGTHPLVYFDAVRKSLPLVRGVERKTAMQLLETAELALINAAAEELKAANEARKQGDTKAIKPADLYRKYHPALEAIINRGTLNPDQVYHKHVAALPVSEREVVKPPVSKEPIWTPLALQAKDVDTNLFLDQSLSAGDLANPDYRDPYTGEQEIQANDASDFFDKLIQHAKGTNPIKALLEMIRWDTDHKNTDTPVVSLMSGWEKEIRQAAEKAAKDLNWDEAEKQAFIQAQMGGFDQDSDDIVLPDDDSRGYTPPTLEEKELVLNKELWWSARDAVRQFNYARSIIFREMNDKGIKARDWHSVFRAEILKTSAFADLIDMIEKVADEDVVTGAAVYMSLAGDFGLMEEDVQGIFGLQVNSAAHAKVSMLEFARAWEDSLLELTQDALSPTSETCPHDYKDVIDTPEFRATMPKYDSNPLRTASWNIGFAKAAMSGADWIKAEAAGWKQWREEMDPKAAKLYDETFEHTGKRNVAMAAFWRACNPRVPRPVEKIKAIAKSKMGLILESGREINWNIVALKLRKGELDVSGDMKQRLLARLQEHNCGKQIWSLLQ